LTPRHRGVTTRPHRKPDGGESTSDVLPGRLGHAHVPKRGGVVGGRGGPIGDRLASHQGRSSSQLHVGRITNITVTRWEAVGGGSEGLIAGGGGGVWDGLSPLLGCGRHPLFSCFFADRAVPLFWSSSLSVHNFRLQSYTAKKK